MRNFELDIKELFEDKIKESDEFCVDLWCALANIDWINKDGTEYGVSFRYSASLIAEIRGSGTYMDWYCSGDYPRVTRYIKDELKNLGWDYKCL